MFDPDHIDYDDVAADIEDAELVADDEDDEEVDPFADPAVERLQQWRPVIGYEGFYEVSNLGAVRSVDRTVTNVNGVTSRISSTVLRQTPAKSGHMFVDLYRGAGRSARKIFRVHRLVMAAFVGPCPDGMEVCHNNGDPTDNRVENLRYGTRHENILDKVRHGRDHNASKTHCKHSHEFTTENTYARPEGGRACKTCRKARQDKWEAKKRRRSA